MDDGIFTFVTWKWATSNSDRTFLSEHVNVLHSMLRRHCSLPFRLICITEDTRGLNVSVDAFPMPETGLEALISPHGKRSKTFPACYRRLWMFSKDARELGERVFLLDTDVIVTGDPIPLFGKTGDFVAWSEPRFGWKKIAGGAYILTTGSNTDVWEQFDPVISPLVAYKNGGRGSDQAWISYKLYPPKSSFGSRDGIIKIGWLKKGGHPPPEGTRLIFTSGRNPPWDESLQRGHPWIKDHWHL